MFDRVQDFVGAQAYNKEEMKVKAADQSQVGKVHTPYLYVETVRISLPLATYDARFSY